MNHSLRIHSMSMGYFTIHGNFQKFKLEKVVRAQESVLIFK